MKIMRRLTLALIKSLDYIWPKSEDIILFGSHGTRFVGGNAKAVFEYIRKLESSPFKCYYLISNPPKDEAFLQPFSGHTIRIFLRAKTILLTHGLRDLGILRPSSRKNLIFLGHGQGPKADGYGSRRKDAEHLRILEQTMKQTTAYLTCSRLDSYTRAYGRTLHPSQILQVGFPRCDILTSNEDGPPKLPTIFQDLPHYNNVILYAITWRNFEEAEFFPFNDFDISNLEQWCKEKKTLLLIRPHANEKTTFVESEYIRYIPFEILNDVTEILKEVDILITDYSSIQTDFLLLNRPIVYIPYDLDEFIIQEGIWFPDYDFWAPGEKIKSYTELIRALEDILRGEDKFVEQRRRVNLLVNESQTPGATKRVYEYLLQLLDKNNSEGQ